MIDVTRFQKIIVPVDFSDGCFAAVDTALDIAHGASSRIYLVHVLPDMLPSEPGIVWAEITNENRAHHVEQAIRERLADAKYSEVKVHVEFGDPGFRIADYARTLGADLIVIPSHGRTGIERLLIGSVAERVVRHAHCPVLVLRPTE